MAGNLIIGATLSANSITARALSGNINVNGALMSPGNVTLDAVVGGTVNQTAGSIVASGLRLLGAGTFILNQPANDVATLAASLTGSTINYTDANAVTIGSVLGTSGITLPQLAGNTVTINAGGDITFAQPLSAGSVAITTPGNIVSTMIGGTQIDTSGANGAISLTGAGIGAAGSARIGINRGAGTFSVTANSGDVYLNQTVGDLNGNFTLNSSGGDVELATTDGNIIASAAYSISGAGNIHMIANGTNGNILAAGNLSFTLPSGTLTFDGTGSTQFASGTTTLNTPFVANMPVSVSGATVNLNGMSSLQSLALSGGSLGGSAPVTINGSSSWSGGTIAGAGAKTFDSALSVGGAAMKVLSGTTLNLNGVTQWSGGGALDMQSATVNIGTGATLALNDTTIGGTGGLMVSGTLTNNGSSSIAGLVTNSGGTVSVGAGTLMLNSAYAQTGSTTDVASGATLVVPAGMTMSAGVLTGAGTVAGDVITTGGVVEPGGAGTVGTLTITGNYTQGASGALNVDLAGTGAGQFDQLLVSDTATLDGALNASGISGYTGSPGDTVDALSAGTRVGTFSVVNGTSFVQSPIALYSPTLVQVSLAPAGTNTWNKDANGDWNDPNNWNLGHVPLAGEDVLIDRPNGLFDITYSTGDLSIRSLVNEENMLLDGGTLAVTQPSFWNETLNIAGGTLTGPGDKTIKNLILSAGAITGAGDVTVTNGYTHIGGAINIGGSLAITQAMGGLTVGGSISAGSVSLTASDPSGTGTIAINAPVSASGNIAFTSTGPIDIQANVAAGGLLSALSGGDFRVVSAMVTAPRLELTFPNAANDYFVNGVKAAITGGGAGLFSGGIPAVLGTTLDVTYGAGGLPSGITDPLIVTATNELIQSITRIMDPIALLGQNGGGVSSSFKENRIGTTPVDPTDPLRQGEQGPQECR